MMNLLGCVIYIAVIGVVSSLVGMPLPRRWFDAARFPYRAYAWEKGGKIYDKFHVRAWKDRVPDISKIFHNMVRKKVSPRPTAESVEQLVQETCVAELIHWILVIASIGVVWIWPGIGGWIVYLLCVLGNLLFIIIQRYNRPRLLRTLRRLRA